MFRPFGPIGIILTQLHEKAVAMDGDLNLHSIGHPHITTMNCPLQELRPLVQGLATRARTAAAESQRKETVGLHVIDQDASCAAHKQLDEAHTNYLRIAQQCGERHPS